MADDGSPQAAATWPLTRFRFSIKIGDAELEAQEVSGLSSETQVIEYRAGNIPLYSTTKMPGIKKYGNITIRRAICKDDKALRKISDGLRMNTFQRATAVIRLLDEAGSPVMTWNLTNAFPSKITAADLTSAGNEVAIESIELAHEGVLMA